VFGLHGPDKHCKAPERANSFASGATSSLGVFKAKASTRLLVPFKKHREKIVFFPAGKLLVSSLMTA